jgi:hypothetical protein
MKKTFFIVVSLLTTSFALAQKATDNFTGKYKTEDEKRIARNRNAMKYYEKNKELIKNKNREYAKRKVSGIQDK